MERGVMQTHVLGIVIAVTPGRLRGGYESSSTGVVDLKTMQIQKLHSLHRLDEDWGYLLPDKLEKKFSWPWKTLTEQQVALGKLEFTKFIVVLSCCQEYVLETVSYISDFLCCSVAGFNCWIDPLVNFQ